MKRLANIALIAVLLFAISADKALATTAAVPTAGIAVTSYVVGAAGATEGALEETRGKWERKLLAFGGLLLMGIDPDPATYLSGTSVIAFPDEYLEFQQLTWYGAFSDMSTGYTGPVAGPGAVQNSGFFDDVSVFEPQAPNPDITFSTSVIDAILTVSWSADPGISAEGESVNIFGALFKSISTEDLFFETMGPNDPLANFYQDTGAQSLQCIPPGYTEPQTCGYPDEPITFRITQVPEPSSIVLFLPGLILLGVAFNRRIIKA
jgi:hypothetical protein